MENLGMLMMEAKVREIYIYLSILDAMRNTTKYYYDKLIYSSVQSIEDKNKSKHDIESVVS